MAPDAGLPARIGIDGYNLALPRGTGVATYARVLSAALDRLGVKVDVLYGLDIDHRMPADLREVTFFDSLDQDRTGGRIPFGSRSWMDARRASILGHDAVEIEVSGRVEARKFAGRMPVHDRILNARRVFRRAALRYRRTGRFTTIRMPDPPAIMHWTYPLPVRVADARNVYTVHDLVPLRLPYTTLDDKTYHYRLIRDVTRRADAICSVSEASCRDVLSFFPDCADRLHNTYQSFDAPVRLASPDVLDAEIDALFGLRSDEYYLFFGSLEPKKNIGRMIEAYLAARTARKLVIVGAMAWKSEDELRFIDRGLETGRIVRLEYLRHGTLLALIARARSVLFPSLSEGFGLPVLEALSLGTPVVTSREGALPEVAGEAAVYVDPYDTASITEGIERIDRDDALHATLRSRAAAQAALFSMARYAERLRAMYAASLSRHEPAGR